MVSTIRNALLGCAQDFLANAYVPFSKQPSAVVLLCGDGVLVPGVRVDSATFSLSIPASLNALTTAVALGHAGVVAAASTRPFDAYDRALLTSNAVAPLRLDGDDFAHAEAMSGSQEVGEVAVPFLPGEAASTVEAGIAAAQVAASRAFVPASDFPVGCVLRVHTESGRRFVPGCNVEPGAWPFTLCGERNAISTHVTYGLGAPEAAFLTCLRDPEGTPCGACRQLLCEHAASVPVWQDRGAALPEETTPGALLPGFFAGLTLRA
jgi:cytidine deaminase